MQSLELAFVSCQVIKAHTADLLNQILVLANVFVIQSKI